ncbi:FAD-dependent oxidoreductase [Luteimonas sp. SJ-92]|uniref:FAD-dependent oxidoreductase n=1 Tax=Luteimonas salinisoli TaxID=2752307 RepID=A0A853J8S2_9GAMM|nr:FAD-dependent oxidoreductase [Luteimonas salinisoli]NZA25098.1 FAD-dependent oxidoreductase [Luteimonas salinisoli]
MSGFDLIVVGAGIVGASCADLAAGHGLRVAIVEAGTVGGGATAASMGHLVALDEDPAELALSRYSLRLWDAFETLPEAEFDRCGTLWVAATESELCAIPAKIARLAAAGIVAEPLDAWDLYALEPQLAPGLAGGVLVEREAVVYPPRIARWLVERSTGAGAALFHGRRAVRLVAGGVQLDDGTVLRGPVLVATGCDVSTLLPELPSEVRRGHLVVTDRHPGLVRHQILEFGYAESAHGSAACSVAFNVQPRPTGQLLIGSSRERGRREREVDPAVLARMLRRAFAYLPALRGLQAIRAWTGLRPCTPDGRPCIGAVPGRSQVWVATGHEGLGVTTATGSAHLLLDLLLGRTPAIDPGPYDPARMLA